MMIVKTLMRKIINAIKKLESWSEEKTAVEAPKQKETQKEPVELHSVWDCLPIKENTQAAHLSATVGFEEWVEMPEIKRRIKEIFGLEYKNDRSLYPYVKTLVDCGLFEATDIGGKRKWRKKPLLLKLAKAAVQKQAEAEKEKARSE